MSSSSASAKFMRLYESLPAEAQQALVEQQLIPLLNIVPKERCRKATATASRLQKKYTGLPALSLKAKKAEISGLLDELARDSKRSCIKERSNKEELLMEATDSLVDWLNDIWKVVYEYGTNFTLAHSCLLFASDVLDNIANARVGCKCSFINMFVPVKIRRSSGKVVKSFKLTGAHNLDQVMLWIWRDLFVMILANGTKRQKDAIPDMLDDIQNLLGWKSLERLLCGGKKSLSSHDEDDEYDDDDEDDPVNDIDDSDGYTDDDSDADSAACSEAQTCPCGYHATHWSYHINEQRRELKELVHEALIAVFKITPSSPLYLSLSKISMDQDELEAEITPILTSIATHSSENFAAALHIFALENKTEMLMSLLNSHYHLLRPRDAPALQLATMVLSSNPFFQLRGLRILEQELTDTANAIWAALRSNFHRIDIDTHKAEFAQILTLRQDSMARQNRIERWVSSVITPSSNGTHPMALAALVIGFPLPTGMEGGDETDAFGYLDMDPNDPDLEDLREEFRPTLKARFEGWIQAAQAIKGGTAMFMTFYNKLLEQMPFLAASDAVEEMNARLADKPSKHHLCDALEALNNFCKDQKKRVAAVKKKNTKAPPLSQGRPSASRNTDDAASSSAPAPTQLLFPFAPFVDTSQPPVFGFGGMDDVD
ncbi:hypothetical protein BV22DRAFT_1037002 [Leucogyrophana mollusca]|uniref:Uncharacterized protein n=1 Tax=Leucogyrophana mollusca TaxID=85980 RepID=A0ACB8BCC5_9AGAM|nr:hypothetical protein BV22DRAFT_1037002 [Leucogyrophana mollusca]